MKEILIRGTSGVSKSLYANGLERAALKAGYKVGLSDHRLFTNRESFKIELEKTQKSHADAGMDLSIIVINDGGRDLQITFTHGLPHRLACSLFIGMEKFG